MQVLTEKLRAPEFRAGPWFNSEPLTLASLRGRVVLVDFWDYSCINCLHTLPYLKEWHARYAEAGLTLVGIHAPEFEFGKDAERIRQMVTQLGLLYPIALDNDFLTWNQFANRAWPAKYLIDKKGFIRVFHQGEGQYGELEKWIQQLLLEINPNPSFPLPMRPIRAIDQSGVACYRPTPELYLGFARGKIGNTPLNSAEQTLDYTLPSHALLPETVYLEGAWLSPKNYIESVFEGKAATIHLAYRAAQVNLVLATADEHPLSVSLLLDGQPVPENMAGDDVAFLAGQSIITVEQARMYRLIDQVEFESHRLTLSVSQTGLRAYAFTFVGCAVPS